MDRKILKDKKMKVIVYPLTNRGTYSEFNNLLIFAYYAKLQGLKFMIDDRSWSGKFRQGLNDYFDLPDELFYRSGLKTNSAFLNTSTGEKKWINRARIIIQIFRRILLKLQTRLLTGNIDNAIFHWNKSRLIRYTPYLSDKGDVEWPISQFQILNNYYFRYNATVSSLIAKSKAELSEILEGPYIGVHLRRGDKIGREMDSISLLVYKQFIMDQNIKNVYLTGDSYEEIQKLRNLLPKDFTVHSNTDTSMKGFNESIFKKYDAHERYKSMIILLTDVELLVSSTVFIGTFSSCLSQYVGMRRDLRNCHSVDCSWRFE